MSIEQLMSIKVTTASKSSQDTNVAPSVISVFTQNDIDKMAVTSLIDVIKHAPGIETSMAPDGQWRVSIRGARKEGIILLLIDGFPFNDFYDGQAQFDLPAELIQKVEIIRGPGSALYGTNAVAGIVNVFTQQKKSVGSLGAGNNHSQRASFAHNLELNQGVLAFNLGINTTDGANVTEGDDFVDRTNFNIGYPTETNRHLDDVFLSASYKQKDYEVTFLGLNRKRGPWVGPLNVFGPLTSVDKTQAILRGDYFYNPTDDLKFTSKLYVDSTHLDSLNQDIVAGRTLLSNEFVNGGFTQENYRTRGIGTEISFEYIQNENVSLLGGVSFDNLKMQDYGLKRNYQVIGYVPQDDFFNHDALIFEQKGKDRNISAVYAQSEIKWQDLFLTVGFRYDHYSDFGNSFNPRLGLVYKLTNSWSAKLLYGSAFRAPTFKELYDNTRIGSEGVIGNKDLQPEENETFEFAVEYRADSYILKANYFDITSKNIISTYDPAGSGARASIENIGNSDTKGIETELVYQLGKNIRFFANYSQYELLFNWKNTLEFEALQVYLTESGSKQLFNQPRTRANLGLDWSIDKWTLFLSSNYGGRASHNNTFPLEGLRDLIVDEYIQYNFSLNYQYNSALRLRFSANNLGALKNTDPDGSSESDSLGVKGLLQPDETLMFDVYYSF